MIKLKNIKKNYKNILTIVFFVVLCFALIGCLAQLVEQLTFNQWVTGSSPVTPTKNQENRPLGGFFIPRTLG